jgi:Lipopolysaccharide-assembly
MILSYFMKYKLQELKTFLFILLFGTSAVINFGCSSYSFTGASVPAHLKTIAIPIAEDKSPAAIPGLRESLTDNLITKFITDNSLQVTERSTANATLECVITSVTDAPAIVSAGEEITSRRVTINVKVIYKDLVQKKTIFENNFTNHGDYVPGEETNKREDAIAIAVEKLSEDILLAVVSGW